MKPRTLAALFLMVVLHSFAAAPDDLAGRVYSESTTVTGVGVNRSTSRTDMRLEPGGRAVGLLSVSFDFINGTAPLASIPANGTWSYRRIDAQTGELTINGARKTLTFTDDASGTLPPPEPMFTRIQFTAVPYDAASPLINCSNRSFVRAGGSAFTGFVITSPSRGRVLVRAVGPSLAAFGITDALRRPALKVVSIANNQTAGTNDGWSSPASNGVAAAGQLVGAFPLTENSRDSAVVLSLAPGAYVAEVSSSDPADSGQVLVEVYLLP